MLGEWQTGSSSKTRIHWEIWPNGNYVMWGAINDSGTITAANGQISQTSYYTQQTVVTAYQLQGYAVLTTHNTFGTAEWKRPGSSGGNTAQSTPTPKRRTDYSTPRQNQNQGQGVGRQILKNYLNSRGF
jgi:hypothetical protein